MAMDNPAGTSTCDRPSGSRPRNRQHRALEYYFGRQLTNFNITNNAVQVAIQNPYRTQLVFSGFLRTAGSSVYTEPLILSWPTHGPLVTESYWAIFDGCPAIRLLHDFGTIAAF